VYETGESVVKLKGVSINFRQNLDYETMRNLTLGRVEEIRNYHERCPQSELLQQVASKRDEACLVFADFRLERSLCGKIYERKDFTKTISFRFVKRKLLFPTEAEKNETFARKTSPLCMMANIIARCERSTAWGFGESIENDERMFSYGGNPVQFIDID
jgi:hypothetical protein